MYQLDPRDNVLRWLACLLVFLLILGGVVAWSNEAVKPRPYSAAVESTATEPYVDSWHSTRDSDIGSVYVDGIVRNPTSRTWAYLQVKSAIYDADGNLLGHAIDGVSDLAPGGSWKFHAIGIGMPGAKRAEQPKLYGR